ncbi:hypothetical protein LBMAG42_08500 [Deltaproteobacteria bacterium]|nr:hypothetical protein LBMAG42_08500 [Deltaproteobacteria bacterium]
MPALARAKATDLDIATPAREVSEVKAQKPATGRLGAQSRQGNAAVQDMLRAKQGEADTTIEQGGTGAEQSGSGVTTSGPPGAGGTAGNGGPRGEGDPDGEVALAEAEKKPAEEKAAPDARVDPKGDGGVAAAPPPAAGGAAGAAAGAGGGTKKAAAGAAAVVDATAADAEKEGPGGGAAAKEGPGAAGAGAGSGTTTRGGGGGAGAGGGGGLAPGHTLAGGGGGSAKVASPSGDSFTSEAFALWTGRNPAEHAAVAQISLATLGAGVDSARAAAGSRAAELGGQVDAAVEERVAQVAAAEAQAAAQVQAGFGSARTTVESAAAAAIAEIGAQANTAITSIDGAITAQLAALAAGFDNETQRLDELRTTTLAEFEAAFDKEVEGIRALGETKARAAITAGESRASGYAGRGGEGIEQERNEARAKAARQTAADFAQGFRDQGSKVADEIAGGKASLGDQVGALLDPTRDALVTQRADAESQLRAAADQAKAQVAEQQAAATAAAESSRTMATDQLTSQEEACIADLHGKAEAITAGLRSAGESLKAQIAASEAEIGGTFDALLTSVQTLIGGDELPNADELEAVTASAEAQIEADRESILGQLDGVMSAGLQQLDGELSAGIASLQQAAVEAVAKAEEAGAAAATALSDAASSFAATMSEVAATVGTSLQELTASLLDGAKQAVDGAMQTAAEAKAQMVTQLQDVHAKVESSFAEGMAKLDAEITKKAEEAAGKIVEGWKKFVAIVVAVVAVVAIVALFVVTLGTAGILVGALLGLCCALGSKLAYEGTLSLLTGTNQFGSPMEYLQTALLGALTGGLAGWLIGPATGVLAKFGIGSGISFIGSFFDQVTDKFLLGESWNWTEFFVNGAVGVFAAGISTGLGAVIQRMSGSFSGLSVGPSSNTWNNFQRNFAKLMPFATSPAQRAQVYRILQTFIGNDDTIEEVVGKAAETLVVNSIENNPTSPAPGLSDPEKGPSALESKPNGDNAHLTEVKVPDSLTGR